MADILSGAVTDWIANALQDVINAIIEFIFGTFNYFVKLIASALTTSPASWKFFDVEVGNQLSDYLLDGEIHEAFVAIAGFILAYVACYELIQIVVERNNLADIDTWIFVRWIFKTTIAMMFVTHGTDIILAIFEAGQWLGEKVGSATAEINVDVTSYVSTIIRNLMTSTAWIQLTFVALLILLAYIGISILGLIALLLAYGHVLTALLLMSVAPIPLATLGNQEWGHIGKDYLKSLASCALEGVIMLIVMKAYSIIATTAIGGAIVAVFENPNYTGIFKIVTAFLIILLSAYMLVFGLKQAKTISNAAFGAH